MTEGATEETVDGMSQEKIERVIKALRDGTFQWKPVRRVYIPKKDGKKRPLGLPDWSSKLVQEVIRLILNAYYEPQFSVYSHGFRPEHIWSKRSELEQRLLADTCEYCGATERCQVHHVHALKDLQVKGRRPKPQWMVLMAARQRKTMIVCKTCHEDITYGRPMRRHETSTGFMHGEPVTR